MYPCGARNRESTELAFAGCFNREWGTRLLRLDVEDKTCHPQPENLVL